MCRPAEGWNNFWLPPLSHDASKDKKEEHYKRYNERRRLCHCVQTAVYQWAAFKNGEIYAHWYMKFTEPMQLEQLSLVWEPYGADWWNGMHEYGILCVSWIPARMATRCIWECTNPKKRFKSTVMKTSPVRYYNKKKPKTT